MNKTTVYILLVGVLIVGLALGYGGARLLEPGGAGEVRNAKLQVGDKAPDFRLPDNTGGYVRLSDFQGKKNVVIAFYPLAWTPV
jgi:cytochrome oxidase Cu insertion factor (SCO1/SenC/PrrC family)